jgi:hypothetical protein
MVWKNNTEIASIGIASSLGNTGADGTNLPKEMSVCVLLILTE